MNILAMIAALVCYLALCIGLTYLALLGFLALIKVPGKDDDDEIHGG
jgi:hypothetical protein